MLFSCKGFTNYIYGKCIYLSIFNDDKLAVTEVGSCTSAAKGSLIIREVHLPNDDKLAVTEVGSCTSGAKGSLIIYTGSAFT